MDGRSGSERAGQSEGWRQCLTVILARRWAATMTWTWVASLIDSDGKDGRKGDDGERQQRRCGSIRGVRKAELVMALSRVFFATSGQLASYST